MDQSRHATTITTTPSLPSRLANALFCAERADVLVDEAFPFLRDVYAFAVEPVIAATITAYHESSSIWFATNAVKIRVRDDTAILFLSFIAREVLIAVAIYVG
jgi:kynureninase